MIAKDLLNQTNVTAPMTGEFLGCFVGGLGGLSITFICFHWRWCFQNCEQSIVLPKLILVFPKLMLIHAKLMTKNRCLSSPKNCVPFFCAFHPTIHSNTTHAQRALQGTVLESLNVSLRWLAQKKCAILKRAKAPG